MTKAGFIEATSGMPDDAELMAFNADSGQLEPVTGLLSGRTGRPVAHSDGEFPADTFTIELCTDEP